jgi:hypothetical protein
MSGENGVDVSTDQEAMLVWGEKNGRHNAELLGYSLNSPVNYSSYTNGEKLSMFAKIAQENNLPLLWVGKEQMKGGILELGEITLRGGNLVTNLTEISLNKASDVIQDYFDTSYGVMGTDKAKNKRTAGGFHDWSRDNLPKDYTKQDLDLIVTSDGVDPTFIIELKRSYIDIYKWTPYRDDLRNYVLQVNSAEGAGAVPVIVFQNKESISDSTSVTLFRINDVAPNASGSNWIDTDRENSLPAVEVKRRLLNGDLEL